MLVAQTRLHESLGRHFPALRVVRLLGWHVSYENLLHLSALQSLQHLELTNHHNWDRSVR